MIKKFIFRNVAQSFTKARQRSFAEPIAKRDMAAKIGARTEGRYLQKGLKRVRARALSIFGSKGHYEPIGNYKRLSAKGKRAKAAYTKASIKVTKIAKRKGLESFTKASKKLGVTPSGIKDRPAKYYRSKKRGLPEGMTTKQMGWAPEDPLDVTQKAFYMKGLPKAKLKKHRATLSKIYAKPKSWKQRAHLKSVYRARAKSELKAAKLDRSIYRDKTIQQQTGTTKRGKPTWKTIWKEPKREFKKWK